MGSIFSWLLLKWCCSLNVCPITLSAPVKSAVGSDNRDFRETLHLIIIPQTEPTCNVHKDEFFSSCSGISLSITDTLHTCRAAHVLLQDGSLEIRAHCAEIFNFLMQLKATSPCLKHQIDIMNRKTIWPATDISYFYHPVVANEVAENTSDSLKRGGGGE